MPKKKLTKKKPACLAIICKELGTDYAKLCGLVGHGKILLENGDDTGVTILCRKHADRLGKDALVVQDTDGDMWLIGNPTKPGDIIKSP